MSALASRKLYSILFQPTFLKLQTVITSYRPCRLLHPFRGDEAAGESHFIKIKTQKKPTGKKTTKKQASRLRLEELDSPTIAGSIHIKPNKEQTARRRRDKWLGGCCLSLILC